EAAGDRPRDGGGRPCPHRRARSRAPRQAPARAPALAGRRQPRPGRLGILEPVLGNLERAVLAWPRTLAGRRSAPAASRCAFTSPTCSAADSASASWRTTAHAFGCAPT